MKIIDVHTHAFPDALAEKALTALAENSAPYKPHTDGTINGLLKSMNKYEIDISVIANIATKKEQFQPILNWSKSIHSGRIIPLGSVHPDSGDPQGEVTAFKDAGFPGIKLHPMYQNFNIDDRRIYPIYEAISYNGMFLLVHSGYDIAFPADRRASVEKTLKVIKDFPELKIIAAHFGAWRDSEGVQETLAGKNIYFDTSFIEEADEAAAKNILKKHDMDKFVFGSDSPWLDQGDEISNILKLKLKDEDNEKIFYGNISALLKSTGYIISIKE